MWDLEWFKISIRISQRLGVPTEKHVISNSSLHKSGDLTPVGVHMSFTGFRCFPPSNVMYIFIAALNDTSPLVKRPGASCAPAPFPILVHRSTQVWNRTKPLNENQSKSIWGAFRNSCPLSTQTTWTDLYSWTCPSCTEETRLIQETPTWASRTYFPCHLRSSAPGFTLDSPQLHLQWGCDLHN